MKRFYTMVSSRKGDAGGYVIELDGRSVKTPMKRTLLAPGESLADALVKEWAEQGEEITPDSMPLTQILSTQIDRIADERGVIEDTLLKYLDTDLLCYRADTPPELQTAQEEAWDQYLGWFEKTFGHKLETTTGLVALSQSKGASAAVEAHVKALDDANFTLLQLVSSIAGSVVLGLAFIAREITADEIYSAIRVEENFKAQIYKEDVHGQDPAQEEKDNAIQAELKSAEKFLTRL